MKKTILVMGEPGSGKTTLMRRLIQYFGQHEGAIQNNVARDGKRLNYAKAYIYPAPKVLLLGLYTGSPYDGTDQLGRNVQPCAEVLLSETVCETGLEDWTAIAEGDRLTTSSFLHAAEKFSDELVIVHLVVSPIVGNARRRMRAEEDAEWLKTANPKVAGKPRREGRKDGVDATWLAGRRTKLLNIAHEFSPVVHTFRNDDFGLQDRAFNFLWQQIGLPEDQAALDTYLEAIGL